MSSSPDGKHLFCDAPNCSARTEAPVALGSAAVDATPATGRWLYVQRNGTWQHFCPSHSGMGLFAPGDSSSPSAPSALCKLLLVVDNSEAARVTVEKIAARLRGLTDALVTLLFSACARCMPRIEAQKAGDTTAWEAYCPGTRSAITKLVALFETVQVPVRLQVQPTPQIAEQLTQETARTKYDAVIVCLSVFVLPSPLQRTELPVFSLLPQAG